MKILDATCGSRGIWYQKKHPLVTYMDIRNGNYSYCNENNLKERTVYKVKPDVVADWTKTIPFPDGHFDMIVFDPPHKIETRGIKEAKLHVQYGRLYKDDWQRVLSKGINELFRVLKDQGIFILKWCECDKPIDDVISLFPYPPIFGTKTGFRSTNHWIVFLKFNVNNHLVEG